jgi:prepilin-type N-terminal cleavage/methylation domain-containing protein
MKTQKTLHSGTSGFTLVEVMIAVLLLSVAVIGASGYRYYAALDARKAAMQMTAARTCLLLCESWRGLKGDTTYDPTTHLGPDLTLTPADGDGAAPAVPQDFTLLGSYAVALNDITCYTTLSWKDDGGLRTLNVAVAWPPHSGQMVSVDANRLFELTTYVPN